MQKCKKIHNRLREQFPHTRLHELRSGQLLHVFLDGVFGCNYMEGTPPLEADSHLACENITVQLLYTMINCVGS
jgi:hypothetical protein